MLIHFIRIFRLLFTTGIIVSLTVAPIFAGVGGSKSINQDHAPIEKLMGIEIETSAIKISSTLSGADKPGFIMSSVDSDEDLWMFEEDTQDTSIVSSIPDECYRNLEFKTIGGFGKESLIEIARDIERLAQHFYQLPSDSEITTQSLQIFLGNTIKVRSTHASQPKILITPKTDYLVIRPQITYQLPLKKITWVFNHLKDTNHARISDFLADLTPSIPLKIPNKTWRYSYFQQTHAEQYQVRLLFKDKLSKIFYEMPEGDLKGFCCLFLYYWYELFNNKSSSAENIHEPGLKQYLGIMSRIPFSQLFEELSTREQKIFRQTFDKIIEEHGDKFKIRAYTDYDGKLVEESELINLTAWYISIVDKEGWWEGPLIRPQYKKVVNHQELGDRVVDLLSPPNKLEHSHSMGAMDISESNKFPLIEIRGYASMYHGSEPQISDIHNLVKAEADWFFDEE